MKLNDIADPAVACMPDVQAPIPNFVSVVIPAFNAGRTLSQTLDSVLAQTYKNIEIIVVDDGSTDTTAEVLRSYGDRIRSIHQPNGGLAKARNTGCRAARGEFIALMDADDLCAPERIAVQIEAMQNLPEAVLCCTEFSAFNQHGPVSNAFGAEYYSRIQNTDGGLRAIYPEHCEIDVAAHAWTAGSESRSVSAYYGGVYREIVHGNFVHPPTVMFRHGVLHAIGMFDEKLPYTCDWECIVRAARLGPFVHINLPMLQYRLSEMQMSSRRVNGEGALCVVRAATKINQADPELMVVDRHRMRKSLGEFCRDAADELAEWNKAKAANLLVRSIWEYGAFRLATIKTILKILTPTQLVRLARTMYRNLKTRIHSSATHSIGAALLAKTYPLNCILDDLCLISEAIPV